MNRLIVPFLLLVCLAATGCSNNDESEEKSEIIRMWVSAQTSVTCDWDDDNSDNPIECMQVKYSPDGSWVPMLFGTIEYFQYEKGVEYELSVIRTALPDPPADGPAFTYRLERIISHRVLAANIQGIDDYIEIPAEGGDFDIRFTANAPCGIARVTGDIFGEADLSELNDSGYSLRLKIPQNTGMGRASF